MLAKVEPDAVTTETLRVRPLELPRLPANPLVSVLLPVFNYATFLPAAIQSILDQSYTHWELIICDDGSTDDSVEIARAFMAADARIRVIAKTNGGQASALNAAFQASRGEVISILDADDVFAVSKLERLVQKYATQQDAGVIVHAMTLSTDDGQALDCIPFLGRFEEGWIGDRLIRRGGRWRFMPSSALSFRREVGEICMPIPEKEFRGNAEAFLFTIVPLFTCVAYIGDPLSLYRIHGSNMSGNFRINLDSLIYWDHCIQTPNRCVNERLVQMGVQAQLDLELNLDAAILHFKMATLSGENLKSIAKRYIKILKLALQDEIFSVGEKAVVIGCHGLALFLPRAGREMLYNAFTSPSPVKRALQRFRRAWMSLTA